MNLRDSVTLRPIEASDESFLRLLYASVREDELDQAEWPAGKREEFLRSQFDAQHQHYLTNYPGAKLDVIEFDGVRAGRLYVHRTPSEIRVMDIALIAEFRAKGIGSFLIQQILDAGERAGLPVTIHVEKWNPAMRLYERLGFRPSADRGAYWLCEWVPSTVKAAAVTT